jgi:hypothetical protein
MAVAARSARTPLEARCVGDGISRRLGACRWLAKGRCGIAGHGSLSLRPREARLLAVPEHEVPLNGGSTASQTDLFVLAHGPDGLVAIAVEGKAKEPFGDQTVSEWRATQTNGRRDRLAQILELLELDDDERLSPIRYQLLHRTASAVIEARRFGARHAVMLVHSFPDGEDWFEDFAAFADSTARA